MANSILSGEMTSKLPFTFNEKQNQAYELMLRRQNVFLTGPGGVGKTVVVKTFKTVNQYLRKIGITSTTGTSAILLGGTTLHSYLGIGYGTDSVEVLYSKIMKRSFVRKRWIELDCLIIDEISMLDPDLFDKLERLARKIRQSIRPFGNIQLILSGDFLQLPCVGSDTFCFEAESWDKCVTNTIYLTDIIRQDDKVFQSCLNNIRVANINEEVRNLLESRRGVVLTNEYGIKPTKLFATNYDVNRINDIELDKLAAAGAEFYQYDMEIKVMPGCSNKEGAIEKFRKNCNAQSELQLCVGAQVMLLKNLDLDSGLCNGSRGVVTKFTGCDIESFVDRKCIKSEKECIEKDDIVEAMYRGKQPYYSARILSVNGDKTYDLVYESGEKPVVKFLNGQERVISDEIWDVEENDKVVLRAIQIPLKIAYAISIHKSQGDSLDYAEMDLSDIFECGQAYVALSRIKSLEGLSIIDVDYDKIKANAKALEFYGH